jgi:phosphoserine phosphatase RsbU/P
VILESLHQWLQFAQLGAGVLIFMAGLVQVAFARPFRRDRNGALASLGVAGLLYGSRLLTEPPHHLISASPQFWLFFRGFITYIILVPILYSIEVTFGSGWHDSIRWMRRIVTAYAGTAVVVDVVTATPRRAMGPNGYLLVATIIVLLSNRFRGVIASDSFRAQAEASRGLRIVRIGLLAFAGFVLFENIVNSHLFEGAWNVEWAGVLVLLGSLGYVAVSRAVENDRRLHELRHELETARQIQMSILPRRMPCVDGVAVAARYVPVEAVAGDFYDFLDLGSGRLGVLVADVSGHGVPAALIASMVKVAFMSQSDHADDPARVLTAMNKVFCGQLERHFVTAAYAFVDAKAERFRYGAAGHPPAVLVGRGGEVEDVVANGVMLGHFPNWCYTFLERPFLEGDRLILYTDGLIEAANERGEFFDAAGLLAFSRNGHARNAEAFADALVNHVSAWSGRSPARGFDDDVTLVVVDRVAGWAGDVTA